MKETVDIPEGVEADYEDGVLKVEKDDREVEKKLEHAQVEVEVGDGEVKFSTDSDRKEVKSIVGTFRSHLGNMLEGLEEDHVYRLKGVYAHFPMTIKQQGDEIHIENFMGERHPRIIDVMDNVEVSIDGDDLELRSPDKEAVSQTAARVEQACKKGNRDPRTFQDGVYIVEGDTSE
ncbi:MAG: 50S ribosomal protein L6 [Candidatus Nanohaloarchaea archaeon]